MNSVNLIGRITRDPELRTSSNGKSFVAFTVAVSEYSGGNQYTQFIPCFAWEKNAENMVKYVKKGAQLGVTGSINVRQTKDGNEVRSIVSINAQRVEFLGSASGASSSNSSVQTNQTSANDSSFANYDFGNEQPTNNNIDVDNDAILFED